MEGSESSSGDQLGLVSFLEMCIPGSEKIFDFLPLSTFLSLRRLSKDMKETVDSSYRFYCHLKSHVIWIRTREELESMKNKLKELIEQDEYSLIQSIQFGLELNEFTVSSYTEFLSDKEFAQKITHLHIAKSINEAFDLNLNEEEGQLLPTSKVPWLAGFEEFLKQSSLTSTLRSLEIDELAFGSSLKFHEFLLNLSKRRSSLSKAEELHSLSIKVGSLKTTNAYTSYLSASGQKGVILSAWQVKERIESLVNSNLRVSLTLRELADFADANSESLEKMKLLSSVENIVDLQSFPSTQQMEILPLVPLKNCRFENVSGLILELPPPLVGKQGPKLSPFYEYLYSTRGAWPQLGKCVTQLTIQTSEASDGERDQDLLLPLIKLHTEGIQKSFPNLKRIQIWGNFTPNEWNAWWIGFKPLRNLWSLSIKARGLSRPDEVFLPPTENNSGTNRTPAFVNLPRLDRVQIYSTGDLSTSNGVSYTDLVFKEVFSRMKIRSFQFVQRCKSKITHDALVSLLEGKFGKTACWILFDVKFDGDFADVQVAMSKLKTVCAKNAAEQKGGNLCSYGGVMSTSHPIMQIPLRPEVDNE